MPATDIVALSEAWHEARRVVITASDWPAILGVSRYSTPLQVWARLTGKALPPEAEKDYLRWGRYMEASAAEWYTAETGREVVRNPVLWRHESIPWLACTPDGFYPGEYGTADWQCKAPGPWGKSDWEDAPPLDHSVQVQAELYVINLQDGSLCALTWPRILWADMPRNGHFIDAALQKIGHFWDHNVQRDIPPEPTGSDRDSRILASMHRPEVHAATMTQDVVDLCLDIDDVTARVDALDAKREELRNALRAWMVSQKCERAVDPAGRFAWSMGKAGLRKVNP